MTDRSSRPRPRFGLYVLTGLAAGAAAIALFAAATPTAAQSAGQSAATARTGADATSPAARGEYITTSVAMCVQCHSTRDERGVIIDTLRFHGGAIPVTSPFTNENWAPAAPNLAGLPGFTDQEVISLLTTGSMGNGRPAPRRPMPPFRMNRTDAEAVVAFLRNR